MNTGVLETALTAGEKVIDINRSQFQIWNGEYYEPDQIVATVISGGSKETMNMTAPFTDVASGARPVMTDDEFVALQYQRGEIQGIPKHQRRSPQEEAAFRQLARTMRRGRPAEDLVREDRGPVLP